MRLGTVANLRFVTGTSLALLQARAYCSFDLFLHGVGPLVMLHLTALEVHAFSMVKVLLEIIKSLTSDPPL